jgi:hypothetical protein
MRGSLRSLRAFLAGTGAPLAVLVNKADKIELLTDSIVQLTALYF